MSAESHRFARAVLAKFKELRYETDDEIAAAGGPSSSTLTSLRKAAADPSYDMKRPRSDSAKRWDAATGWPPGTALRIWDGVGQEESEELRQEILRAELSPALRERMLGIVDAQAALTDWALEQPKSQA